MKSETAIGIIGGSGLYELEGLENKEELRVTTPFGDPSDSVLAGQLCGRQIYFLPRHGRGHRIAPHEINHRANIYALRELGVRWCIAVTAVGSLRENYHPRHVLVPDQIFDRTSRREHHTFFGQGIVAHISFADPYSADLRKILLQAAGECGCTYHDGGVYVNMDGPAFSTRAESETNRQLGFDVIGMTNAPEAKLAREAEMAMATLAFITDYDCWKTDESAVTAESVGSHLRANIQSAKAIISSAINHIPRQADWPEHRALDHALLTSRENWNPDTHQNLRAILSRLE